MAHKVIVRMLAVCVVAMMTTVSALAQDYKTLLGKWNMTSETEGDPVAWILVLKENDGRLTAVLGAGDGAQAVKDFTYANGLMKFKVPYQGEYYDIELKVSGEKLDGKWIGQGNSGRTTGIKS